MSSELSAFFERVRPAIDRTLDQLLPAETASPSRIHQAMRYSTLNGGKRIRPSLCVAAYAAYQEDWQPVLPVAAAIEMIHSYSLIHDDLPAMDDDDYRRGKPSCHKQFDEALAILAGDGLLTLAFEVLAGVRDFQAERVMVVSSMLARAAGTRNGMLAGQVLDLEAEGKPVGAEQLDGIHRSKTGALIAASVRIGAYLGGAPERDMESIKPYGENIGLAFQIIDDILDVKDGGDRDQEKATYPALYGAGQSGARAHELMEQARQLLASMSGRMQLLKEFCDYLEKRKN